MQAGKLRSLIFVQAKIKSRDPETQEQSLSWVEVYKTLAQIDIQNSALLYEPSNFISQVVYRITFNWTPSYVFSAGNRIVYLDQSTNITHTYEIKSFMNPSQMNRQIIALCYEVDGSQ